MSAATGCDDGVDDALGLRAIAAMDHDGRSLAGQSQGDCLANAFAASRHQARFAVKLQIHRAKPIFELQLKRLGGSRRWARQVRTIKCLSRASIGPPAWDQTGPPNM